MPYTDAPIFAQTSGYLKKWYFDSGTKVKAGEVLAEIDIQSHSEMPAAMTDTADGLPVPQRYWAILTIALGLIMAVMDGAIANVSPSLIAPFLFRRGTSEHSSS
jgi:pyruvate/2-oxoglutarate dehydrogenase complex dihydrolipoamide acyltransferase (E2) component